MIVITPKLLAIWYVAVRPGKQDWMAALTDNGDGTILLQYRHKYYADTSTHSDAFDDRDTKHWYEGTLTRHTPAQAIEKLRLMAEMLAHASNQTADEILMVNEDVNDFHNPIKRAFVGTRQIYPGRP